MSELDKASAISRKSASLRTLVATCGAHAIQDGMLAVQYVLLPVLAQSLGLSYAQVGFVESCQWHCDGVAGNTVRFFSREIW